MGTRMLALGHSELMTQHQDPGILPPRLAARQAQQRHGPANNQEDQLQARKPTIIARPARPGPASQVSDTGTSRRRPEDICAAGTGSRHPQAIRWSLDVLDRERLRRGLPQVEVEEQAVLRGDRLVPGDDILILVL